MATTTIRRSHDRYGRACLIIPADDARALKRWIVDHWTEIPGVADGYSDPIGPGHHHHDLVAALFAEQRAWGQGHPFIIGEGFPIGERADRRDYDLLVSTFGVQRTYRDADTYRFGG